MLASFKSVRHLPSVDIFSGQMEQEAVRQEIRYRMLMNGVAETILNGVPLLLWEEIKTEGWIQYNCPTHRRSLHSTLGLVERATALLIKTDRKLANEDGRLPCLQ